MKTFSFVIINNVMSLKYSFLWYEYMLRNFFMRTIGQYIFYN